MFLGIDIGSVSIKFSVINEKFEVIEYDYFRTNGDLLGAVKKLLEKIKTEKINGIAVTGSGRKFLRELIEADFDVDEITAHRKAVKYFYPNVKTIFEIGGQDSKLIYFSEKTVNFEMNNSCAAGTGSFLDQQAARLGMGIEEFYKKGLSTKTAHKIASKCTVFAETDMIHAQQSGVPASQIIRGLHRGMIRNYFMSLCGGKKISGDFLFEGGTSENKLLVEELATKLLEEKLITEKNQLIIPKYNKVIGAIGTAILCKERRVNNERKVPKINDFEFLENGNCFECANKCGAEISKIKINDKILTIGKSCKQ